jgi:hypothetical protein
VVKLNVGTFEKVGNSEYFLELRKEVWGKKSLLLKYIAKGVGWHWIGLNCVNLRNKDYSLFTFMMERKMVLNKTCKRHEILKVLFEILGVEIEEL